MVLGGGCLTFLLQTDCILLRSPQRLSRLRWATNVPPGVTSWGKLWIQPRVVPASYRARPQPDAMAGRGTGNSLHMRHIWVCHEATPSLPSGRRRP